MTNKLRSLKSLLSDSPLKFVDLCGRYVAIEYRGKSRPVAFLDLEDNRAYIVESTTMSATSPDDLEGRRNYVKTIGKIYEHIEKLGFKKSFLVD